MDTLQEQIDKLSDADKKKMIEYIEKKKRDELKQKLYEKKQMLNMKRTNKKVLYDRLQKAGKQEQEKQEKQEEKQKV